MYNDYKNLLSSRDSITRKVNIEQVLQKYVFEYADKVDGHFSCFLHSDNNKSMKVINKLQCTCEHCGKTLDIFDIVQRMLQCTFREALSILKKDIKNSFVK